MPSTIYNSRTSTTTTSLGVAIVEARLNRLKASANAAQPAVVNVVNVLKVKSYRSRGIDLMMHVKRNKTDKTNDIVSICVETSDKATDPATREKITFETITNDAKRIRVASDFLKSDARMWYYLSIPTATLYQFSTNTLRDWFKTTTNFNHEWFEPRTCDLTTLQKTDPRWVVTGEYQDFDTVCRSWGVEIPLHEVLTSMHTVTGKPIQPIDVLEEIIKVSANQGVLVQVWDQLYPEVKHRALSIVERHQITFSVPDPIASNDASALTVL